MPRMLCVSPSPSRALCPAKQHKIQTRRSASRVYVEFFLQFDEQLLMGEVQRRIDVLSELIRTEIPGTEVVIVPSLAAPAAPAS